MSTYIFKLKNRGLTFTLENMDSDEEKAKERFANCLPEGYSLSDFDVTKEKPCPYCHVNSTNDVMPIYRDYSVGFLVYPDGSIEIDYDDDGKQSNSFSKANTIKYCPMCGRQLGEEGD